jgi:drug/metabolite transporter (DMT)-like permease
MIWLQGIGCFLIWALYGIARTRRSHRVRNWARTVPIGQRGALAGALFVLPAVGLAALIFTIAQHHWLGSSGLQPFAWVAIVCVGLGYVHCQTLATALLVSIAEER